MSTLPPLSETVRIGVADCDFSRKAIYDAAASAGLAESLGFETHWYMDVYGERLNRSHKTLYATCNGEVVGAVFIEPTVHGRVDRDYLPADAEEVVELGGLFVNPDMRGKGVAQALARHAYLWAAANGYTVICSIEPENHASKKALNAAAGLTYLYTQVFQGVTLEEYVIAA